MHFINILFDIKSKIIKIFGIIINKKISRLNLIKFFVNVHIMKIHFQKNFPYVTPQYISFLSLISIDISMRFFIKSQ